MNRYLVALLSVISVCGFLFVNSALAKDEPKENMHALGGKTIMTGAREAEKGDGYSTYSYIKGPKILNVTVTCSCGDGTSATKSCPTSSYQCNCPNASITCD